MTRAYVFVSCLVFATLLGGAAFFGAAIWLVPGWVQEVGQDLSREIARLSGGTSPAGTAASEAGSTASQKAGSEPRPEPAAPSAEPSRPVPAAYTPAADAEREEMGELMERLDAWERLRKPLFALLRVRDGEPSRALKEDSDIRPVAEKIAARLTSLREEALGERSVLDGLDARTFARILVEEESISDGEALRCLERFPRAKATEALERLSHLSPERAGRLLRGFLSMEETALEREDGGRGHDELRGGY